MNGKTVILLIILFSQQEMAHWFPGFIKGLMSV